MECNHICGLWGDVMLTSNKGVTRGGKIGWDGMCERHISKMNVGESK